jgi:ATP-binding cassette subfamily B protein
MDCGPASLTCLLAGYGIPVSYGRLREACQTDVDGTSIDTIEVVANELGVRADQVMIPVEHLFLDQAPVFPALVVVRHADGPTHFVVVWRRIGAWLQVMDPSIGRRWVRCRQFAGELFRHETSIPAAEWRAWAATDESLVPLREILSRLGAGDATASQLIDRASADEGWFAFGALDASTRLVEQVIEAGGVKAGAEAVRLLTALFQKTCDNTLDIFKIIPPDYWSVSPDPKSVDPSRQRLLLRGAVLLQVSGRTAGAAHPRAINAKDCPPLSPELAAALNERPPSPLASLWGLLKSDGILAPLTLMGAMCLAAGATLIEALLFRGIFDIGALLNLGSQRLVAVLGLLTFMGLMLAFRFPIVSESLRFGRRLETRLRMALLQKMPQLTDRYFQSRPISDMADRNHSIQISRILPGMGVTLVQSLCALILTLCGIALIDSISAAWALGIALCAIVIPGVFQPMINERYLRARNHYGALNGFYLDALLGLVPIRVHRAELAVRYRHEGLLVEWVRSCRRLIRASVLADGLQSALCLGLACALLVEHFIRSEGVTGADLLLVYWTLNLSALGRTISALAHQYPVQRNVLLRLLEPLAAPAGIPPSTAGRVQPAAGEQSHVTEPPHSQCPSEEFLNHMNHL